MDKARLHSSSGQALSQTPTGQQPPWRKWGELNLAPVDQFKLWGTIRKSDHMSYRFRSSGPLESHPILGSSIVISGARTGRDK
jgi:hypothetical protein